MFFKRYIVEKIYPFSFGSSPYTPERKTVSKRQLNNLEPNEWRVVGYDYLLISSLVRWWLNLQVSNRLTIILFAIGLLIIPEVKNLLSKEYLYSINSVKTLTTQNKYLMNQIDSIKREYKLLHDSLNVIKAKQKDISIQKQTKQ
ncbi:hypothetical protein [Carboxylicivirga caseinilyticus]|uniref:hypothetical protein n=1 Tax=Carboxylicivirga caseinilyticus TaxID=3417572 RepID=UPI003D32E0E6|nr:hypothetical protein [Marinilabiliaceae bacterium A049]